MQHNLMLAGVAMCAGFVPGLLMPLRTVVWIALGTYVAYACWVLIPTFHTGGFYGLALYGALFLLPGLLGAALGHVVAKPLDERATPAPD